MQTCQYMLIELYLQTQNHKRMTSREHKVIRVVWGRNVETIYFERLFMALNRF